MSFAIVTDTSANLPGDIIRKYDVKVVPLSYYVGENEGICLNNDKFDSKKFYDDIRNGAVVTTSQIVPERYINYIEPLIKEEKDILFVGMSSGVSGSFGSAKIAAKQLTEKYDDRKICLVDSLGASLGEGLLVIKAVECREQSMSLEETKNFLDEYKYKIYQVFTVDNLMYLRRSGRISNVTALMGTMLNIKPMLKGNKEGKIVNFGKIRGRKQVIKNLAQKYEQLAVNHQNQIVGISHADCEDDALKLADLICNVCKPQKILIVTHEPVTGSHLGPGGLALFFEGQNNVRDN